ncbi:transcriptional repressor [Caldicoprobacter algeriensis]|uniref:Fur family transcriptional regulator n=1 Tax=Caldicoprobacter algeriensis TaxID=699281 RepID=UPI0020796E5F|nr:Fur family transcriptional regulator [Caldicoprobacter algeriensis]MCM8900931.1 transcriptional repressor [Caldicoprobacter algeriensis]
MSNDDMNRIKEILKEKGYKLTPQRRATLEVIMNNKGKHMSTEEIYFNVKKICPEIGLATVYRTMLLFEELGILYKHNFDDGKNRYELSTMNDDHHHHHLVCLSCGQVIEVEEDLLDSLEEKIEEKHRFKIVNHNVKFFGYCSKCRHDEGSV